MPASKVLAYAEMGTPGRFTAREPMVSSVATRHHRKLEYGQSVAVAMLLTTPDHNYAISNVSSGATDALVFGSYEVTKTLRPEIFLSADGSGQEVQRP